MKGMIRCGAAVLALGVLGATPAATADDEVIDEGVITARYVASTIGKSPAPLIETPFAIDVVDLRDLYNIRALRTASPAATSTA